MYTLPIYVINSYSSSHESINHNYSIHSIDNNLNIMNIISEKTHLIHISSIIKYYYITLYPLIEYYSKTTILHYIYIH